MAAPRRSGRSRFSLFILLLASVTLLTLDARDFGPVERLKDGVAAVVSPLRSLGNTVFSPVGNAWENFSNSDDLEAENRRLRQEVEELRASQIDDEGAAERLEALQTELGLRDTIDFDTVVAEVTAGSISNFDQLVFEINRGSSDGVRDGMPVVTTGGLIGKIEDTGQRTARVRLISDSKVQVGVLVVGPDEPGIMAGKGDGEQPEVGNGTIPVHAEVSLGDAVVTLGGERSAYPRGLPVGTVAEINVDERSLEQVLRVQPSASLSRFEFVTVVLYDPASFTEPTPDNGGGAETVETDPEEGSGG